MRSDVAMNIIHCANASNVSSEENLGHRLAGLLSVRDKWPHIGGRLCDPRIRGLIDFQIAYLLFRLERRGEAARTLESAFEIDVSLRQDTKYSAGLLKDRGCDFV